MFGGDVRWSVWIIISRSRAEFDRTHRAHIHVCSLRSGVKECAKRLNFPSEGPSAWRFFHQETGIIGLLSSSAVRRFVNEDFCRFTLGCFRDFTSRLFSCEFRAVAYDEHDIQLTHCRNCFIWFNVYSIFFYS